MNYKNQFFLIGLFCAVFGVWAALFSAEEAAVAIPQMSDKAREYYRTGNVLWVFQQLLPLVIFVVLLFSGASAKLGSWAKKWGKVWFFEVVLYVFLFALIFFVVQLPLSYYSEYVRPHQYGLSSQEIGKWFMDTLKGLGLSLLVGEICIVVIYLLIRKSPKRWWLYTTLLTLPFIILSFLIAPIWIEPLFNHFGPMKDKALEAKILHLASRAGISGARVFEVDKSQDTKTLNAYVTGIGGSKRIVLWDTIIKKLPADELLFVMGHEMGHFVLHHVEKWILFQFSLNFFLFLFLSSAPFFLKKLKASFGIKSVSDIASLPLLFLMSNLFFLVTDPISNALSRHVEHQADRFGLEITQNNHAAAEAFVKLQQENLANPSPGPLYVLWRSSHPSLAERITFCNTYRPWEKHQPLEYQEYIKSK